MRGSPEMMDVVHRLKYQQALWLEPLFSRLFAEMAVEQIRSWRGDCLVPVPLHPVRFRERGFNQAETLCRNLSRDTGLIVLTRAVKRIRVTRTQALLSQGSVWPTCEGLLLPPK